MNPTCPCRLGEPYDLCCGRFHSGEATPPTAERLMRSRFTAFAVGDADYLVRTWHPRTRPKSVDLDPGQQWVRLDILATDRGGLMDDAGTVEFRAHFRHNGTRGSLHENSRFLKENGEWLYLDGTFPDS